MRPAWLEDLKERCRRVVQALEGEGSVMVDAGNAGYDPVGEMTHRVTREAVRDLGDAMRRRPGFDPDVFFAHRLALYFTAWYSWITEAKSRDADRDRKNRSGYWTGHKTFIQELEAAIEAGEDLVEPIMEKRKNRILPRRGREADGSARGNARRQTAAPEPGSISANPAILCRFCGLPVRFDMQSRTGWIHVGKQTGAPHSADAGLDDGPR